MKKGIFFMMLFVCISYGIKSQTIVQGGVISGTWSLAGSPYLIQGNVQINNNATLLIEPGVSVIFQGYYKLNVQGKLLAIGTASDTVKFTAADTVTGWQGIKFINTPDIGMSEIKYCDIMYAKGNDHGGAIFLQNYSAVVISNCRIAKCQAGNGGAIGCWSWSDPVITNNLFEYNSASDDGGAIWCMGSHSMEISNNIFINNTANSGGAIFCYVSSPYISNNVIANNTAILGGGIRVNNNSNPNLINNTIVNNSAENGGGLYSDLNSFPIVRNTIIWGNAATTNGQQVSIPNEADPSFYYCNVEGGQAAFFLNGNSYFGNYQNNINSNPLFVNPASGAGVNYYAGSANWSLQNTSPCIDSGDPNQTYPQTDMAGNIRVSVCKIDMGAYEFQKGAPLNVSLNYSESFHCTGGANGNVFAHISGGGGGPYAYLWSNGATLQSLPVISQGVYSVTVTDLASMCTAISDTNTISFSSFQINAGNDKTLYCTGTSIQLDSILSNYTGNQALIYQWQPTAGLNFSDIPNPVSTAAVSTTYSVTVTTSNGCTSTDQVSVFLTPLAVNAVNDTIYCGDLLTLNNVTTNYTGGGNLTYQWSPPTGLDNDTIAHPTVSVNQSTQYYMAVTSPEGCTANDSIHIHVKPFLFSVSTSDTLISCGNSAQLDVQVPWTVLQNDYTHIYDVFFLNADTGFIVGETGLIKKTQNGGFSWTTQDNLGWPLYAVYFVNDQIGYAAGGLNNNYVIIKTTDGGLHWHIIKTGFPYVLKDICFTDALTGYAVGGYNDVTGASHIILKTVDGGLNWNSQLQGSGFELNDLTFINNTSGFAVGSHGKILKTTDGGSNWTTLSSGTTEPLYKVMHVNPNNIYIAGSNGNLLKTSNGGTSWQSISVGTGTYISLHDVYFTDTTHGYAVSSHLNGFKIYKTNDGGITWTSQVLTTPSNIALSMHFPTNSTGYIAGYNGSFAKIEIPEILWSPSAGLSNDAIPNPIASPAVTTTYTAIATNRNGCTNTQSVSIQVNPLIAAATQTYQISCGQTAVLDIHYTNYNGTQPLLYQWSPANSLNFDTVPNPVSSALNTTKYYVTVTTPNGCTATDSTVVNVSPLIINAGLDQSITCGEEVQLNLSTAWMTVATHNFPINDIFFINADTGFFVSNGVYRTINGGLSWHMVSQYVGHNLRSIFFVNQITGYAVGDDGLVMKTTDGENWNMFWAYNTQLKSVYFTHPDTGYVVGDGGVIRKTVNGGLSWTIQTSGTTNNLRDVFFITTDIGFAVGNNGICLKTTNGGANWSVQSLSGINYTLYAVYFADAQTGFICGAGSTFLKTTDGGNTWSLIPVTWLEGRSIYFSDAHNGYVSGMCAPFSCISKTNDGGLTWSHSANNNMNYSFALHFPNPNTGYALGKIIMGMSHAVLKLPAPPNALTWSPSTGLSDATIANPIANPVTTTTYTVSTLTGACPATDSVVVFINPLTVDAGQNIWDTLLVCKGTVQLDSVQTNLSNPAGLSYLWLPSTGLNNNTVPNPFVEVSSSITYHLSVSTQNGCSASDSIYIHLFPLTVNAGQDLFLYCGDTIQLDSVTHNYYGSDTLFYQWAPSAGLSAYNIPNPVISASNTTYTVTISNNDCEATDALMVTIAPMASPDICIVSVDSTNRNVIVWEKNQMTAIDTFYVYKETNITGNFMRIAAIPYDSLSIYVDVASQPHAQSNRYKISSLDSCGLETQMSTHHKTMHLAINQGMGNTWNLIWEPYEGFAISSYNIYRGTHPDTMSMIGTMAGVNNQYSDVNAPSGYLYYQVEIMGSWCNPSKAYNYSRSNIATNNPSSIFYHELFGESFHIYPNPASDIISVVPHNNIQWVKIYDALGRLHLTQQAEFTHGINISSLPAGLYFIEISQGNYTYYKKIIKK